MSYYSNACLDSLCKECKDDLCGHDCHTVEVELLGTIYIDTDNKEFGRVVGKGIILESYKNSYLIQADNIRTNIIVPKTDVRMS